MALPAGFTYRKPFSLDPNRIVGGPHTLPLWLNLGADADLADTATGCLPDGRDIRFTAADAETLLPYQLVPDGQFLSFDCVQHSTVYDAANGCYYFCFVDSTGRQFVHKLVLATGAITGGSPMDRGEKDDHGYGGLIIMADGRLMYAGSTHNDSAIYIAISTNPGDPKAWGEPVAITPGGAGTDDFYSYPRFFRVSALDSGIRLYYRNRNTSPSSRYWGFIAYEGPGWGAEQKVWDIGTVDSEMPYCWMKQNSATRIDFGGSLAGSTASWHFWYDVTAGIWKNSDGTEVTLPIEDPDVDLAASSKMCQAGAGDTLVCNAPTLFGSTLRAWASWIDGGDTDHYYARENVWSGSEWVLNSTPLVDQGGPWATDNTGYGGGLAWEPGDEDTIYAVVEVAGVHEIQQFSRNPDDTWTKSKDITSGSTYRNIKLSSIVGSDGLDARITWISNGTYDDYDDFTPLCLRCYPGVRGRTLYQHGWVLVDGIENGTAFGGFEYWGKADAVDAQNAAAVFGAAGAAYSIVCHATKGINQLASAAIADASGNSRTLKVFDGSPGLRMLGPTYECPLPAVLMGDESVESTVTPVFNNSQSSAGATAFSAEGWMQKRAGGGAMFLGNYRSNSYGGFALGLGLTGLYGIVIREPNDQDGGSTAELSLANDVLGFAAVNFVTGANNYTCRLNGVGGTFPTDATGALDATASGYAIALGDMGPFYGSRARAAFGGMRYTLAATRATGWLDTQYANVNAYADFIAWGDAQTAATSYTLAGDTSGLVNQPVTLTVTLNGFWQGTITPACDGDPFEFSPPSYTWDGTGDGVSQVFEFTFTPTEPGTYEIECTNDGELVDPDHILYEAEETATRRCGIIGSGVGIGILTS